MSVFQIPLVADVILARLHEACMYTIPQHLSFSPALHPSERHYYLSLGYQLDGQPATSPDQPGGTLESTDSFVERLVGYVTFLAAMLQVSDGGREGGGSSLVACCFINRGPGGGLLMRVGTC